MSKTITDHLNEQRNETPLVEATSTPATGIFTSNGKSFQTYTFNTEATANSFLEVNKGYGVIGTHGDKVHVARMKDTNTTANKQSKDGKVG